MQFPSKFDNFLHRSKQTLLKINHRNGEQALEKMHSFINQRNANKNQIRYHLTTVKVAIIKETRNNRC